MQNIAVAEATQRNQESRLRNPLLLFLPFHPFHPVLLLHLLHLTAVHRLNCSIDLKLSSRPNYGCCK